MTPKRSYSRIAGLSVLGVLIVVAFGGWLLATPSDDYVLLPDDPHPADAVVSVGGAKPTISRDGSGIYYLDVLVHRASLPESWIARFEDGADVVPAAAIVPPGGSQRDLDRIDHLTFQDSRTVAGVVALRALGHKVDRHADRRHVRRRRALGAGVARGPAPRHGDHRRGRRRRRCSCPRCARQLQGRKPGSPVRLTVRDGRQDARTADAA